MIVYEFPFAIEEKERERARCFKGKATVYSPASTKKFYQKIRTYILKNYPEYETQIIDYNCKLTMVIGLNTLKDKADIDNRIKMIDALLKDRGRKENTGFKGLFKDDKFIKWIDCRLVHTDNEFTNLLIEPFEPSEFGIDEHE